MVRTLSDLVRDEVDLRRRLDDVERLYVDSKASLTRQLDGVKRLRSMASEGIDVAKVQIAESLLTLQGDLNVRGSYHSKTRLQAVECAIDDLATTGGEVLRKEYVGVKNYAGFGDQRFDCEYGYGPSHGYIVFSIRLNVRDRALTPDEIEACIYTLELFKAGRLPSAS